LQLFSVEVKQALLLAEFGSGQTLRRGLLKHKLGVAADLRAQN
jgi:hypothetical protein